MGLSGVWFIAGIAEALIAVILLVFAKEHFVKTKVKIKEAFNKSIENAKKGLDYILKHPVLFYFLVDTIIWSFAAIWSISWQPYFKNLGLANEHFGLLFALIGAIGIIAPFTSNYVLRLVKSEKMALISAQIVQVVVFSLLIIVSNLWYALFLFILIHPVGIAIGPIAARFKQQFIPSKNRATINSILNAVKVPGMMVGLLVGGLLLDKFGVRFSFVLIVMSAICSIVLYSLMKPEKAKIHI
jgi:predicted MFS family arabinose efflux permease